VTIGKHTLALISIIGSSLDVLGALYLAYDLLGGEHGPLRTLTRGVTYTVLFGSGYALFLGPVFGVAAGAANGLILAAEYSRTSKGKPSPGFWYDTAMSALRGAAFGLGAAYLYGAVFGVAFGAFSTVGQVLAYRIGIRPELDCKPSTRPGRTKDPGEAPGRVRHRTDSGRTHAAIGAVLGLAAGCDGAVVSSSPRRLKLAAEVQVSAQDAKQHQGGRHDFAAAPTGARALDVFMRGSAERETADGCVVRLGSHEADADHDDC
jgi:hypothetical protein